ncbi:MAG: hypothetical protein QF464_22060, partial [Myxococcota bacterium]|nr:hypothetical protein [Myxococcota bacterium]
MDADALAQLEANLKRLAQLDLALARRIIAPVDDCVIDASDASAPVYIHHHDRFSLCCDDATREGLVGELTGERPALVFGAGDVALIRDVLDATGEQKVIVWDRDPALVRVFLATEDWTSALTSGRLVPCLGVDLVSLLPHRDAVELVVHPLLGQLYEAELEIFRQGLGD